MSARDAMQAEGSAGEILNANLMNSMDNMMDIVKHVC